MVTTAGVFRDKNTTELIDDASPSVVGQVYSNTQRVTLVVPATPTSGWLDIDGTEHPPNALVTFFKPSGGVVQAADPITQAEFALLKVAPGASDVLEIVRYTADGPIQDKDHRAIFETGADNMTLPVSTQDRLIQLISEGPATVITADGTEQFIGPSGTTTDSTLNVNETFQWATLLGRGAAAGWSQYVGQVATAQSVGAMVDFSESPGPGDAGSFSLALTNSGANLRYILTLTCSNGTNFSPPLDVDDGANRWWYDFDHTTGVVNIRRFGAFAGGSVRGVALYS